MGWSVDVSDMTTPSTQKMLHSELRAAQIVDIDGQRVRHEIF